MKAVYLWHIPITIPLTHWGQVTHICVSKLTTIGSDNGLSPGRCQAIIWINARILFIQTLGTNCSEILGKIHSFSFKKMQLKMLSAKGHLFSLSLNELTQATCMGHHGDTGAITSIVSISTQSKETVNKIKDYPNIFSCNSNSNPPR